MKSSRSIHGVLLLDKPLGWSSNQAVQRIKRLYQAAKVGHTGTLDPLATGVLPLCLGEATKFGQCLLTADKSYEAVVQLGQTTTTGDREGEILSQQDIPELTPERLQQVAAAFTGVIEQVPPMFSALKVAGQALYQLARRGEVVERAARPVTIYSLSLTAINADQLQLSVRCSKGTYIRTLAEDIGAALACGAHLHSLRRTAVGNLPSAAMVRFEQLQALSTDGLDAMLLPIDRCVDHLPSLNLAPDEVKRLLWGQAVYVAPTTASVGLRRLYDDRQRFLGLADWQASGQLLPQRLINATLLEGCTL